MTGEHAGEPFGEYVGLFQLFLAHREEITGQIQALLNAQRKPAQYLTDGALLLRHFEDCCFGLDAVTAAQRQLRGQTGTAVI